MPHTTVSYCSVDADVPVLLERFRMIAPDFPGFGSLDYASNVALYPQFQAYLREAQLNLLALWGRFYPFFVPVAAEEFRRDIPGAYIQFVDAGHFALEADVHAIAVAILEVVSGFFGKLRC